MSTTTLRERAPSTEWLPKTLRFSKISLPSRDLAQSRRFFVDVLGGVPVKDGERVRARFANFDVVAARQDGGATAPEHEYPHYAFTIPPEMFVPLKKRLEGFGIPTHDPWTRTGETHAIMYFRDPSENQFELFTPEGDVGLALRLGDRAGGDYVIPFASLVYDRIGAGGPGGTVTWQGGPIEFNHMTIPANDFDQCRRFHTEIFGGTVTIKIPNHVTIVVGGFDIGYGGPAGADWPWPDVRCENPRYTLSISADELPPMIQRLKKYGIPVSDIWSANGADSSVYFRDPASNLWELICEGSLLPNTRLGKSAGGDYQVDLAALCYSSWRDPGD